jgi:formylglycine-generating enzyme required for sulfatase activity
MALLELAMVTGAIVEMGTQALVEKLGRRETVTRILKKLNIDHEPDPTDFGHIYRYALVEWGVWKPRPVLDFFREPVIEKAFRAAFYSDDDALFLDSAAGVYERYLNSGRFERVEYDPRREFDAFRAVFEAVVDRGRAPADVKRDRSIAELHGKIDAILARFPQPQAVDLVNDVREQLTPYLEAVARRHASLPIAPLDPAGRESAPIALGKVFINLDAGMVYARQAASEAGLFIHERYSAALAHIHAQKRLIILGDPGSGKSTLLRFLAYCLAKALLAPEGDWLTHLKWTYQRVESPEQDAAKVWASREEQRRQVWLLEQKEKPPEDEVELYWPTEVLTPVFIELRNFARTEFDSDSALALWEYARRQMEALGLQKAIPALETQLLRGKVIFLLDGVDEVSLDERPLIWRAISAMENGICGGARWVATCRSLSFSAREAPPGVPVQTLQPLNSAQIETFIESWYQALVEVGSAAPAEAAGKISKLKETVTRPRLRELAENPMLLTIMALVQTYYGTLPDERARLYQMCVETLLLRWQRHKESAEGDELPITLVPIGDQQQLERLLWEIAWEAHGKAADRDRAADIPEDLVLKIARQHLGNYARAEQFIEYTEQRAHLLIGKGGVTNRTYTFPHRVFELAGQGDAWREVLNLAAGTLVFNQNNIEKALDGVAETLPEQTPDVDDQAGWFRVWLAGEMALVVGRQAAERDEVGRKLLPRLCAQLAALVSGGRLTPVQRAEAGAALGGLGDSRPDVACDVPFMVEIPAGPFLMGSIKEVDEQAFDDELPQHTLDLPAYKIGKYPVTVAQYRCFVAAGGYANPAYWTQAGWRWRAKEGVIAPRLWDDPRWTAANHPVVGVSWYEAAAYCAWLKATTGRNFRLPNEAMWEKAARGTDGRIWPWGNTWDGGKLNSGEAGIGRTTAVGAFPDDCSPFGVYDTAGNVSEWCSGVGYNQDQARYPFKHRPYGEDLVAEGTRCWRGGAWNYYHRYTRAAFRDDLFDPDLRLNALGFRVAEHLSDPDF